MDRKDEGYPPERKWAAFGLIRKQGTLFTLFLLGAEEGGEMDYSLFLDMLEETYGKRGINSYFRVKPLLLKYRLISFRLNEEFRKMIFLTRKGTELLKYYLKMTDLLFGEE